MTVKEIKGEVERIRCLGKRDDESAHGAEDALLVSVLSAIANGEIKGNLPRRCAKVALKTLESKFSRWCG